MTFRACRVEDIFLDQRHFHSYDLKKKEMYFEYRCFKMETDSIYIWCWCFSDISFNFSDLNKQTACWSPDSTWLWCGVRVLCDCESYWYSVHRFVLLCWMHRNISVVALWKKKKKWWRKYWEEPSRHPVNSNSSRISIQNTASKIQLKKTWIYERFHLLLSRIRSQQVEQKVALLMKRMKKNTAEEEGSLPPSIQEVIKELQNQKEDFWA